MASRRQIAIVVLGGALAGCAPVPPPPPPRHVTTISRDEPDLGYPNGSECGGNGDDERPRLTPEQRREELAAAIEVGAARCQHRVEFTGRHGEVRVTVERGGVKSVSLQAERGSGGSRLTDEDRRCVEAAARAAIDDADRDGGVIDRGFTVIVTLGTAPPLFASTAKLTSPWLAARRSKAAGRRFAARLPAEVALERDGCLSMPARKAFNDGLARWLANETAFHEFWQGEVTEALMDRAPGGGSSPRAYWLSGEAVLLHRQPGGDLARQEICLFPFDAKLKQELRARIDRHGTCWAGDLDDILLHPRTEFPSGRRFKTVAAGPTRACALDDGGAPICCGERLPGGPPAATLAAIAVGPEFDCGIADGGDLLCWGGDPPAGGGVIPGPYKQVAVAGRNVCAIRRDTRALECWDAGESRMNGTVRGGARDAAVSPEGVCALLEDGRISCLGLYKGGTWRELPGPFRAVAASAVTVCGVTARTPPRLRCWWNREGWPDIPESDLPLFATTEEASEVALSGAEGCVLARSGQVACWPERRNRLDGVYRTIAAGGDGGFCALTADGRAACDRAWPYREGPHP